MGAPIFYCPHLWRYCFFIETGEAQIEYNQRETISLGCGPVTERTSYENIYIRI